jgi:hypothetical protein
VEDYQGQEHSVMIVSTVVRDVSLTHGRRWRIRSDQIRSQKYCWMGLDWVNDILPKIGLLRLQASLSQNACIFLPPCLPFFTFSFFGVSLCLSSPVFTLLSLKTTPHTAPLLPMDGSVGLFHSPKRFNVAISRARSLLLVVGHPESLDEDEYVCVW